MRLSERIRQSSQWQPTIAGRDLMVEAAEQVTRMEEIDFIVAGDSLAKDGWEMIESALRAAKEKSV